MRRDLRFLDDESVKTQLMKVKGIGNWTADIYLLMVLRRPDIWPKGDLALATALQASITGDARLEPSKKNVARTTVARKASAPAPPRPVDKV